MFVYINLSGMSTIAPVNKNQRLILTIRTAKLVRWSHWHTGLESVLVLLRLHPSVDQSPVALLALKSQNTQVAFVAF